MSLKRLGVLAIQTGCLAALVLGVVWNVRFAVADLAARRNQPESTRLAMRWMPENGAYPAQLADEIYALDPVAAKSLLQRAVQLNRYDAASWIQLGLLSEAGNDLPGAEEALLQAASVDATFLPSWSLANFYFRRENTARFWYWAQKAAADGSGRRCTLIPPGLVRESQCRGDCRPSAHKKAAARSRIRKFPHGSGRRSAAVAEAASHLLAAKSDDMPQWIQLDSSATIYQGRRGSVASASVDTTFLPSWSLANFYFRRENTARFWYWAQKAAQMDPDDAAPLFRLAWYVSPNAGEIASRLQIKRPLLAVQFVNFLMAQGDPQAVAEAARSCWRQTARATRKPCWGYAIGWSPTSVPIWRYDCGTGLRHGVR